jgi:two-component SAPR family response regulator
VTRVLVLDDDVVVAELMRVILEDAGFETITATTAASLPRTRVDCIVSDLVEVVRYNRDEARDWVIRLGDLYPRVPIVILTAHSRAADDRDHIGADRVIMKPFDVDLLLATIEELTER